jgi:hypothetical protein
LWVGGTEGLRQADELLLEGVDARDQVWKACGFDPLIEALNPDECQNGKDGRANDDQAKQEGEEFHF